MPISASTTQGQSSLASLGVGIGLRAAHYRALLEQRPKVDWLEIHSENYFESGGWDSHVLETLRADYPISMHGVGLGIGSAAGISGRHLEQLKDLVNRIEPVLVSEHLCWGAAGGRHLNDLLPMPLTPAALALVCQRVEQVQRTLRRQILLENVSTYLRFRDDAMSEAEFLATVAARTGCGILLDINNLYVNQCNHDEDAVEALQAIVPNTVGEFHLSGHLVTADAVIDHHGDRVAPQVWTLYEAALQRFGTVSTLIEWDTDIPDIQVLLDEAEKARTYMAVAAESRPDRQNAASLPATQERFANGLFDVEFVSQALPLFKGEAELVGQRFALYRGNLAGTWSKALGGAYPVLKALVGAEYFDAMAKEYGSAYPSQAGDLNLFGAHLSSFLVSFEHAAPLPYLPDMARLEWALHRAHYAPAGSRVKQADFAGLQPEQMDSLRLTLRPACSLFHSDWAIIELWQAHQPGLENAFPCELARSNFGLIVRPHWRSDLMKLSAASFAALSALELGETLGIALDAALEADSEFDFSANLQQWIEFAIFDSMNASLPIRENQESR